jgi:2-oxo-4-hydroxy-4-carboxy-5-ureidoimidazoline decarboxylase
MTGRSPGVDRLNVLSNENAEQELMACCGSKMWAGAVAAARPFADEAELAAAADRAFVRLGWADVLEALSRHPRIGDPPEGDGRESAWSRVEQSGARVPAEQSGARVSAEQPGARVSAELRRGNLAYEGRFGHVFLICATGLSAERILSDLRRRVGNDPGTEREAVRTELQKITRLRLARLAAGPGEDR